MISGIVTETLKTTAETVWIEAKEPDHNSTCGIHVKATPKARAVAPGDFIWWQDPFAYWSPKALAGSKERPDIVLYKVGNSGAPRPTKDEILQ